MKLNVAKKIANKEGFTLVELMIVVAIIGILAAIAIPQFAAYRIRGYNSSAQSDTRNLNTSQAALFADYQNYGVTVEMAAAGAFVWNAPIAAAAGVVSVGGNATLDGIATNDRNGQGHGVQIPVGNGVAVTANIDAVPAAGPPVVSAVTFSAIGKHTQGDTTYGVDGDSTNVYQNSRIFNAPATVPVGSVVANANIPATTAATDDFATAAAVAAFWVIK